MTVLLAILIATTSIVQGQPKNQNPTTKTEPSDKYGEGGSVKTTTNEKYIVTDQVWKDKNGKVREIGRIAPNPGRLGYEQGCRTLKHPGRREWTDTHVPVH